MSDISLNSANQRLDDNVIPNTTSSNLSNDVKRRDNEVSYNDMELEDIEEKRNLINQIKLRLGKPNLGKILSDFQNKDYELMNIEELEKTLYDIKFCSSQRTNTTLI